MFTLAPNFFDHLNNGRKYIHVVPSLNEVKVGDRFDFHSNEEGDNRSTNVEVINFSTYPSIAHFLNGNLRGSFPGVFRKATAEELFNTEFGNHTGPVTAFEFRVLPLGSVKVSSGKKTILNGNDSLLVLPVDESSLPPKRKPGRPSKKSVVATGETVPSEGASGASVPKVVEKKKPGRKSRKKTVVQTPIENSTEPKVVTPKKRRGRPPKNRNVSNEPTVVEVVSTTEPTPEVTTDVEPEATETTELAESPEHVPVTPVSKPVVTKKPVVRKTVQKPVAEPVQTTA